MMRPSEALAEAAPFVVEIVQAVNPTVILFEGATTLSEFERHHCADVRCLVDGPEITTANGRHPATIYRCDTGVVTCLERRATLLGVAHPSKYARRAEWPLVIQRTREVVQGTRIVG
jgi:hypothetical protein